MVRYQVWNGVLESVTVLDEHYMCPGATVETCLVKYKDGREATISREMFSHENEAAAWSAYAEELRNAIPAVFDQLRKAMDVFEDIHRQLQEIARTGTCTPAKSFF